MGFVSKIIFTSCLVVVGSMAFAQGAVVIGKTSDPVFSDLVQLAGGSVLACKPELEVRNGVLSRICRGAAAPGLGDGAGLGAGMLGAVLLVGVLAGSDSTTATTGTTAAATQN